MKKKDQKWKISSNSKQETKRGESIHRSLKQNTSRKKWELDEIISKQSQL